MIIKTLKIGIKDKELEFTIDEAKQLFEELSVLFANKQEIIINPLDPLRPIVNPDYTQPYPFITWVTTDTSFNINEKNKM